MEFVRSATEQSVSVKPVTHEPTLSAVKHRRPSVGLLVPVSRALLLVAFNGNQDKTDFIFARHRHLNYYEVFITLVSEYVVCAEIDIVNRPV